MSDFNSLYTGRLWSIMSWDQLAAFWQRIEPEGWYLYAVGEEVPAAPVAAERTAEFIRHVDTLLRKEHHHDYCSIVYADDLAHPSFVKIYDPDNLGVSCGFSANPPLPGWIMSRVPPEDLKPARPPPENRRRWWRSLSDGG
ncbi:MAG: hypothetical protein OHM77_08220 [Candidatus Nitricoxidivorans perseverans]|uniref:Uncharacterized protein n=1 Tax=Candidatus Nitricoxidivorans perseverans TaxID=2975601 RepID=A0AA49FJ79_9PROT|nr:MAG: hypothetical protein OHM77_08220 [Candidatus Nitricoxidivorans perseverans]